MNDQILQGNLDPLICVNGSSWCNNCTQDCSDFDDGLFMKFMFMKWAYDRYQSPLRLIQFIFNGIFQNKCFWRAELLPIQEHRSFLKDNGITEIMDAWYIIEGYLESNQSSDYLKSLFHDCASPICTKPDLDKINEDDLDQPKIHGNLMNDFVLVPLCSFGTPNLGPCTSFKPSEFTFKDDKCFTFNHDKTDAYYSNNSIPDEGFNFLLNYGMPLLTDPKIKVILHEQNVAPDIHSLYTSNLVIKQRTNVHIGITATSFKATSLIGSWLQLGEKDCLLNAGKYSNYSETTCAWDYIKSQAENQCGCIPYKMIVPRSTSNGTQCQDLDDLKCIAKVYQALEKKYRCIRRCIRTKYESEILTYSDIEDIVSTMHPSLDSFIKQNPYLVFDANVEVSGYSLEGESNYLKEALKMFSLVQINFKSIEITTVTKDVKVSIPDMIGTIGGTFGIFLGLSTLGLVQSLLDFIENLKQWFNQ